MARQKVLLSWSSGKDSAWALHLLSRDPALEVVGLVTTVNGEFDRVAMHAVRRTLLLEQARATGITPWIVEIPHPCSNEDYEAIMGGVIERALEAGISAMAFGDIFLEDIRAYRETQLEGTGMEPLFPLWGADTWELARRMISGGVEAFVTCVDPKVLDPSFAGRTWDGSFLEDLPPGVDPCGERGEFHTFVRMAPVFNRPLGIRPGVVTGRDGFIFADILPD